ncbi:hypothetical protein SRHO_G00105200 [Serrasalmus rhombeus]
MDIIIQKKVKLIRWLSGDSLVLQHVQSQQLVTMDEYRKLMDVSDRADRITKLLDTILSKGDPLCLTFLNLLKEDDVNESSPELRQWIGTVNTSEQSLATGRSETDSTAGTQINPGTQIQGGNLQYKCEYWLQPKIRSDEKLHNHRSGMMMPLTPTALQIIRSLRKIQSASNDIENTVRTIRDLSLSDQMPVK